MVADESLKKEILKILMKDSRTSFRTIAKDLKLSTSTVSKIVKELEESGIILGYSTIVDWQKFGYDSTLCLQITISPEADIDKVGTRLRSIPAVKQVFYTTGEANFSAYAVCLDTSEATTILEELRKVKGIERVVPHTVLKSY